MSAHVGEMRVEDCEVCGGGGGGEFVAVCAIADEDFYEAWGGGGLLRVC